MSLKILHTADLHLGSRMHSLGQAAADFQVSLMQSFSRLLEQAEENEVDLFLIAGDFLEMAEINDRELERVCDILARERSFPVLIVAGNHDPYSTASPYVNKFNQIPLLYVFPADEIMRLDFPALDTSVWGSSFGSLYQETTMMPAPNKETASLVFDGSDFQHQDLEQKGPLTNKIGLLHGELLAGSEGKSAYNPLPQQMVRDCGLAYLALGHIHKASDLSKWRPGDRRSCLAMYPGSPQGLSFNEPGSRHALLVELEQGELVNLSTLSTSDRMFMEIKTRINSGQSDQEIIDQIMTQLKKTVPDDFTRHYYRIRLEGEVSGNFSLKPVEASLQDSVGHIQIIDELRPAEDLSDMAEEETLRGLFLRKILSAIEEAEDETEEDDLRQALRFGLTAFRGEALEDVY